MGVKVLNIIEYGKYFWIAIWIVFRTFAEKGRDYCILAATGRKPETTARKPKPADRRPSKTSRLAYR